MKMLFRATQCYRCWTRVETVIEKEDNHIIYDEKIKYTALYYKCPCCDMEYTTAEMAQLNFRRILEIVDKLTLRNIYEIIELDGDF